MKDRLTKEEMAGLDTRFVLGRMKSLMYKIPVVKVHPRQYFLPSGRWCSIFKFLVPVDIGTAVNFGDKWCNMHKFTVLGAPGGMYRNEDAFSNSYAKQFNIRGAEELVQPFAAIEALAGWDGWVEVQREDLQAYKYMSQLTLEKRKMMVTRLKGQIEGNMDNILATTRVYGVLKTLQDAENLIRCAKFDAEKCNGEGFHYG